MHKALYASLAEPYPVDALPDFRPLKIMPYKTQQPNSRNCFFKFTDF